MRNLETISLTRLTVLEFGQHIKSICSGIEELGNSLINDEALTNYITTLKSKSVDYDKAILQVTKSDETAKIIEADKLRDTAVSAAMRYLSVFELSENTTEHEAYVSLKTLFNVYKGIQSWNFEEETNGLDNLISELSSDKYTAHVTTLNMTNYVARMTDTNENFKPIFRNRTQETSTKEVFDVKAMRKDLMETYTDMATYVMTMAKVLDTDQFNKALNVINTIRKYYADLLAKRKPVPTEKTNTTT